MNIVVIRDPSTDVSTLGKVYVNGLFQCYSLEDVDRRLEDGGTKIPGETAIPRGVYKVVIDWSNRFKKEMMHVLDVPGFEGVRIHTGNFAGKEEFLKKLPLNAGKQIFKSNECIEVVRDS